MKRNVKLNEEDALRLEALAAEMGMPPEVVLQKAIVEFCAQSPHLNQHRATSLFDVYDVMRLLRIRRTTLDKLVKLGRAGDPAGIKSLRIGGRLLRFRHSDLNDYINRA